MAQWEKPDGATWGQILTEGQKRLEKAGIAEYSLDAWYLFEHAFGISRMQYFMCSGQKAEPEDAAWREFSEGIERRSSREPLQHILGTQEFMGLEFEVNQYTLIPRQDTETLVELVLENHKKKDIALLDMCTGSGCIAISLAVHGGSAFDGAEDQFDIIVSNPPYIPSDVIEELEPEVRDFEPRGALDGTADGLYFYEILARECGRYLKEDGAVYFEIGHDQGDAVKALLDANGFYDTKVIKDLAGNDRVVCGRWQTK